MLIRVSYNNGVQALLHVKKRKRYSHQTALIDELKDIEPFSFYNNVLLNQFLSVPRIIYL